MKQIIFMASLLSVVLLSQVADAQIIGKRQQSQRERIRQGMRQGDLTKREGMQLRMQQARIRGNRQMAMADGRITPGERKFIRGQQRHAGNKIYNYRHNGRFRHHMKGQHKGWGKKGYYKNGRGNGNKHNNGGYNRGGSGYGNNGGRYNRG